MVLHGVFKKAFLGRCGSGRSLSWFQGWRKRKWARHKNKSIAMGVGVKCCIEFGLDAQKRRRRRSHLRHTGMMCCVGGLISSILALGARHPGCQAVPHRQEHTRSHIHTDAGVAATFLTAADTGAVGSHGGISSRTSDRVSSLLWKPQGPLRLAFGIRQLSLIGDTR